MKSIVQDLQSEALNTGIPVTNLLRKSLVVAKKLKLKDFEAWIRNELEGYKNNPDGKIPTYRMLSGVIKAWNPYNGWIPVTIPDKATQDALTNRECAQSISEIEHLLESKKTGTFQMHYPGDIEQQIMDAMGIELQPVLKIGAASLNRILDSVRNSVLTWALQLEEDGILGDEISFTESEIEKAAQKSYIVNNFFGPVVSSQIQQGTVDSSQDNIK